MPKPTLEFHLPQAAWQPAPGAARGIWNQPLALDESTGASTGLQRYDPGADSTPNGVVRHDYWEEVYLIAGDLTDLTLGQTFTAGMFACRPPGMIHGPWRSATGALMIVWCSPS